MNLYTITSAVIANAGGNIRSISEDRLTALFCDFAAWLAEQVGSLGKPGDQPTATEWSANCVAHNTKRLQEAHANGDVDAELAAYNAGSIMDCATRAVGYHAARKIGVWEVEYTPSHPERLQKVIVHVETAVRAEIAYLAELEHRTLALVAV